MSIRTKKSRIKRVGLYKPKCRFAKDRRFIRLRSTEDIYLYLKEIAYKEQELLVVLCLDKYNYIKNKKILFIGNSNKVYSNINLILKEVIVNGCDRFAISHNHTGGIVRPSKEDLEMTRKLIKASNIMDIKLIDHVIISKDGYRSLHKDIPKNEWPLVNIGGKI